MCAVCIIIGRIGGDEYIAFLKEGAVAQKAEKKAAEICKAFHVTYNGPNGEEYTISSSVGISFFPKDGRSFVALYNHADAALYCAKRLGKNNYYLYDGSDFAGYQSNRTEIQTIGNIAQKGFKDNKMEYIFKILYDSENPVIAIHSALELVARHFSFERGYIFETDSGGKTTSNTYEWCAENITPQINNLQNIPLEVVENAHESFQKTGTFIVKSLDALSPVERAVLEPQGIKSMVQFGIFNKGNLLGLVGFDNCTREGVPSDTQIDELETICKMIAMFFVQHHLDMEASSQSPLLLKEIINNLNSYAYVIDPRTFEMLYMNEKTRQHMSPYQGRPICYQAFRGNTAQCEDCPVRKLTKNATEKAIVELYNSKLEKWIETVATPLPWADNISACLITCMDVTKYKNENLRHIHELENLAYVDELTGARTYHKFKQDAQHILENSMEQCRFLVKVDIYNFKLVNQIYGYEKGNEVLRYVAQAIQSTIRNEDEIFARIGNDEFIALFAIETKEEIEVLNQAFLRHFYELVGSDFTFKFHFPHGRYLIHPNECKEINIMDMFEKVNIAHRAAKLHKSKGFVFYDDNLTAAALYEKNVEDRMEYALQNNEFLVYLQPKYYLKNETVGGAEALVRWEHDSGEMFYPSNFIPIFERNSFITRLDFYMLYQVCAIIQSWMNNNITPVVISVNFSRLHLGNSNFVKELCQMVDSFGVERKFIEIEITETVIYDNIDVLETILDDLHLAGFTMSMDDFGSGYSSLGMLMNLPVDVIKMDRSFFANQKDAARSKTVVGCIIKMASDLHIRIVAEGVEEQKQIDFLRELHCDMVQGYYYAKPMPVQNFTTLISEPTTPKI